MARHHQQQQRQNGHDVKHTEANGVAAGNGSAVDKKKFSSGFISRVSSYPIVTDGVTTVQAYANKSSIGRFALSKANNTLERVGSYHQPKAVQSYYEQYVQPHLARADSLGCRSLDLIQERFPLVNQPTQDIVEAAKSQPNHIITGVRGRLSSLTQPTNQRLTSAMDSLQATLDHYLPPGQQRSSDGKPHAVPAATNENHVVRAYGLLHQATTRVGQLMVAQIPKSREDVARTPLVQSASAQLHFLSETLRHSVTVYSQALEERLPQSVVDRLHSLHNTLLTNISGAVDFVKQRAELPSWLKASLHSVSDAANQQLAYAKAEYARTDIKAREKAKNVITHLHQTQLLPLLSSIQIHLSSITENHHIKND
ncbi:hypothetical protein BCR43DRAFT_487606 [Syncephalastrum racemosum]|uniref:Uncharacterized protein n=1 Tax=Syncephalastrum racemosum TaxID=13706 RepID=A0A1X2HHH7_SYNRA|nr:hypothetical protein BCR43DRAFT_487606 [Syncephalastrum racemosum]